MSASTQYRERLRAVNGIRKAFDRPTLRKMHFGSVTIEARRRQIEQILGVMCSVEASWVEFIRPEIAFRVRMVWVSAGYRVTPCHPDIDRCVTLPDPLKNYIAGIVPGSTK